jgi:hypothetical protein
VRGPLPPPASAPAWAEPRRGLPAQLARAVTLSRWHEGPACQCLLPPFLSSSSRRRRDFPSFLHRPNPPPNLFPSLLYRCLRAIKTESPRLPAPYSSTNRSLNTPWWLRSNHRLHRPPLRAACAPCFIPGHDSALGEFAFELSTRRCSPFAFSCSVARVSLLRPWRRRGRVTVGSVPAGASPVLPRSNLDRWFWIRWSKLEDTDSAGVFAKETLCFSID